MNTIFAFIFSVSSIISFGQTDIIMPIVELLNIKEECQKVDSISFKNKSGIDTTQLTYTFQWPNPFQYAEYIRDFKGNLIHSRVYSFDSLSLLISEQIIDVKANDLEYIYYANSSDGRQITTYVSKSGTKIVQSFDYKQRLKKSIIDVTNDSINYIFGYPPKYKHDYDYDSEIKYKYRMNKLVKSIEVSRTPYPLITIETVITYKYSKGKLVNEQRFEDRQLISNKKLSYDKLGRLIGFTVNNIDCTIFYLGSNKMIDCVEIYRNSQFIGKLQFAY